LERRYESRKKQAVLDELVWFLPSSETPFDESQLFVEPIIITLVLYKQFYDEQYIYKNSKENSCSIRYPLSIAGEIDHIQK